MRPKEVLERIKKHALNFRPIMVKGIPGGGKTSLFELAAKEIGYDFIPVFPAICDPTDAKGIPGKNKSGDFEWQLCGLARRIVEATKPTLVLLDDFGQAAPMVQAAFMQWLRARMIGEHPVPDCVTFGLATNRREDMAAVSMILEPVKSRCYTIIELDVHVPDWVDWALRNNIRSDVVAWIYNRPDMLYTGQATKDIVNHSCPRSVEHLSGELEMGFDDLTTLAGAVGEEAAMDYISYIRVYKDLPDLDEVEKNPKKAMVPPEKNSAALYAVASALASRANKKNFKNLVIYSKRLPEEFGILLVRDSAKRNPELIETDAFGLFCESHPDILL